MSSDVPPEPPATPEGLELNIVSWDAGKRIVRCHASEFGGTQYNPSPNGSSRFRPFRVNGAVVPVIYGADVFEGALAETVFHDVLGGDGDARVFLGRYRTWMQSVIAPRRPLRLVDLSTFGLRRLGLSRRDLIDTGPEAYAYTARWATVLHGHAERVDGLRWASRLYDLAESLILFETRVPFTDLKVVDVPLPLGRDPGLSAMRDAAERAAIALVEEPT